MTEAADFVAGKIAQRYAHPGRHAYLYLFQVSADADFAPLVPAVESVAAAWVDEGEGLQPVNPSQAIERCRVTYEIGLQHKRPKGSHERRLQMARCVLFSTIQPDENSVQVKLVSRSLVFSPAKGDREAHEVWRHGGEGWYSEYQPD